MTNSPLDRMQRRQALFECAARAVEAKYADWGGPYGTNIQPPPDFLDYLLLELDRAGIDLVRR